MEKKKLTNEKSVKLGLVTREVLIRSDTVDDDKRTVDITFSSEEPYERWFGVETLSHKTDHVDLAFMASGNAPLLAQHNHEEQIGIIEKAWLQDGAGHAKVRFGKSRQASEYYDDVRDGIRKNASVGYSVAEMKLVEEVNDGPDRYLVTRWTPKEASIVSVPADETVGIRSADDEVETTIIRTRKEQKMDENKTTQTPEQKSAPEPKPVAEVVDMVAVRAAERHRQANILAIGKMSEMEKEADAAIDTGTSSEDFRKIACDKMIAKSADRPAVDMASLSKQDMADLGNYSFLKALRESTDPTKSLTGLELEMHQEGEKQFREAGKPSQGSLTIPYQVLARDRRDIAQVLNQRDLTVGTDDQGGYTVGTNLLAGSFIELLQNRMMTKAMGATVLDNLVGDIAIPGQATGATAAWEGENDANAESSPTFNQLSLTPNRVGTYTEISKKLIVQSSVSVEAIVRKLLADSIALAIDLAALHGTGANDQPTGIAATSGIGSVAGGTNGLAPTWAHIIELETDVAVANADLGAMGYLSNAKVRGKLKGTLKASSVAGYIWGDERISSDGFNTVNGYRAGVSNQVSSALTKGSASGTCSAIFFGNWADLILAFWGGLDIVVDPFTLATTNLTRITTNTYADVGVRHAGSFSAMLDALTA